MRQDERHILDVWEFDREDNLAATTIVALDRLNAPDLHVELASDYGDADASRQSRRDVLEKAWPPS